MPPFGPKPRAPPPVIFAAPAPPGDDPGASLWRAAATLYGDPQRLPGAFLRTANRALLPFTLEGVLTARTLQRLKCKPRRVEDCVSRFTLQNRSILLHEPTHRVFAPPAVLRAFVASMNEKAQRMLTRKVKKANVTKSTRAAVDAAMSDWSGDATNRRKLEFALEVYAEGLQARGDTSVADGLATRNLDRSEYRLDPSLKDEYTRRCRMLRNAFRKVDEPQQLLSAVHQLLILANTLIRASGFQSDFLRWLKSLGKVTVTSHDRYRVQTKLPVEKLIRRWNFPSSQGDFPHEPPVTPGEAAILVSVDRAHEVAVYCEGWSSTCLGDRDPLDAPKLGNKVIDRWLKELRGGRWTIVDEEPYNEDSGITYLVARRTLKRNKMS